MATRWWARTVPHWVIGSINLAALSAVSLQIVAGGRLLSSRIGEIAAMAFGLLFVPGLLLPIWYLYAYRRKSRFFSLIAWLTVLVCGGLLAFSFLFAGA
jgi:hypothetical protein